MNKIIDALILILKEADENRIAILGNEIWFEKNGEEKSIKNIPCNEHIEEIMNCELFECDTDNMQLFIRLI